MRLARRKMTAFVQDIRSDTWTSIRKVRRHAGTEDSSVDMARRFAELADVVKNVQQKQSSNFSLMRCQETRRPDRLCRTQGLQRPVVRHAMVEQPTIIGNLVHRITEETKREPW